MRHNEDILNGELAAKLPWRVEKEELDSPHVKTHLILQVHAFGVGLLAFAEFSLSFR